MSFFKLNSSPTWGLMKRIKRSLHQQSQADENQLSNWQLPYPSLSYSDNILQPSEEREQEAEGRGQEVEEIKQEAEGRGQEVEEIKQEAEGSLDEKSSSPPGDESKLLPIPNSQFPIPDSQFSILNSQLTDLVLTEDKIMQELDQSQQKLDTRSQLEQSLGKSNGNLTPTGLKTDADINIEQHVRDERQWLFNVASQLSQAPNTQALLTTTVNEVRQHFQAERVLIYRCQTESRGIVEAESMMVGYTPSLGESLLINTFGAERRLDYRQQQVVALNNVSDTSVSPHQLQLLEKFQVKASLSLPIVLEGQLWGLLVLQQCSDSRQWQEAEIMLLCQLVTELRLHLQPLEVLHLKQKQARLETILEQILGRTSASSDTYAALGNISQELRQFYGADRVVVYRFNADWSGEFVAESVAPGWIVMLEAQQEDISLKSKEITAYDHCTIKRFGFPAGSSTTDTFLQETQGNGYFIGQRIKRVDDIYNAGFSDCYISTLKKYQTRAYLIAPIFAGERLWGLLAVYQNSGPRHWQDEEVTLLSLFSERLGSILKELKFAAQLQEQSQQLSLAAQREQVVANLLDQIRRTLDINTIFKTTTKEVMLLLKADRVVLYRFNPDWSGEFVSESVATGWVSLMQQQRTDSSLQSNELINDDRCGCKELKEPYFPAAGGYLQSTQGESFVRGKQYKQVDDIYATNLAPYYLEMLKKYEAKAYVIMPVFLGEKLWGLLGVYQNSGARAWEETEVRFLAQISSHLAVALWQRNCLEQLQSQSTQIAKVPVGEQAAAKLISKLCQGPDVENFFQDLTTEIRQQLKCDRVAIYRFYDDGRGEYTVESMSQAWIPMVGATIEPEHWQENQGGRHRYHETLAVDDIHQDLSEGLAEFLDKFETLAFISVPIFQGEKLWGLLTAHQNSRPRNWDVAEVSMLAQIGRQFLANLQQAEYLEQLEAKTTEIAKTVTRERATARAIDNIRKTSDLDTIFRSATQEVRKLLNAERITIYKFRDDYFGDFIVESESGNRPSLVGSSWEDPYLNEHQGGRFLENEPYVVDDVYNGDLTDCHLEALEYFGVKSCVVVSIFQGSKLWGLLSAFQHSSPRHWEEGEVNVLTQVGAQLGVALQQAEYLQQLQEQSEQISQTASRERATARAIDNIRKTSDIDTIFRTATQEVRKLLNAERVTIYKFRDDYFGDFIVESESGNRPSLVGSGWEDTYLNEHQGGRFLKNEPFVVDDVYNGDLTDCHVEALEYFGVKSCMVVSIFQGSKLWGLLSAFQHSSSRHWEEGEVSVLTQIGTQLGIALQQAEYLKQLQEQSEQISKTVEKERAAARAIDRIRKTTEIDSLGRITTQEVRINLKCDRAAVYAFEPDWSGKFVAESVAAVWVPLVGPDVKTIWEDTYLQETQGGRYRRKETFAVDDIYKLDHSICDIEYLEQFEVKAYITVPIFVGDKLWGLLAACQNSGPRHWEEIEVNFLAQIGLQFGVALQQVQYIEQLQSQSLQLTKLAQRESDFISLIDTIGQRIAERLRQQNFNTDSLFRATTQEIRQLLQADRVAVYRFGANWSGEFVIEDVGGEYRALVGTEAALVSDPLLQETQGNIYRHNEANAVSDISKADKLTFSKELLQEWGTKAYMVAPMFKGDELWGLLMTQQNSQTRNWEQSEVNLLVQMARQLGIVLQQVESFEQIQQQSQQLKEVAAREKADKQALQQGVVQLLTAVRPALGGDLTVRAPVTENEVGTVADAYNNTLQSLRSIVKQVQASSRQVTQTSQESDKAIAGLTAQAQQQFQALGQALAQIQMMV
ncbi:MAG: GAF domain-containing protein, partial [Symploca sp. SIO2G7]|nr:GAF domain-containing protein [Symploca sp. SIO2G7]